jgi:hypothetical protein
MARAKSSSSEVSASTATIGFEAKLWLNADKLRNNTDAEDDTASSRCRRAVVAPAQAAAPRRGSLGGFRAMTRAGF